MRAVELSSTTHALQTLQMQTQAQGESAGSRIQQLEEERDKLRGDTRELNGRIDLARADARKMLVVCPSHGALSRVACLFRLLK